MYATRLRALKQFVWFGDVLPDYGEKWSQAAQVGGSSMHSDTTHSGVIGVPCCAFPCPAPAPACFVSAIRIHSAYSACLGSVTQTLQLGHARAHCEWCCCLAWWQAASTAARSRGAAADPQHVGLAGTSSLATHLGGPRLSIWVLLLCVQLLQARSMLPKL